MINVEDMQSNRISCIEDFQKYGAQLFYEVKFWINVFEWTI